MPFFSKAQVVPSLGSANQFGLLSGSSISASDSVKVYGYAGALSSIDSKVSADSILISNPQISNAINDVFSARNSMSSQIGLQINGLLNGQNLSANVYSISGDAVLTDTLRLQGDTNSVFIFNINGNLTLNSGAMAILNSKEILPNKVYWNVSGNVTIGEESFFSGIVLAAGNISTVGRINGRLSLLTSQSIVLNGLQNSKRASFLSLQNGAFIASFLQIKGASRASCTAALPTCNEIIYNGSFETLFTDPPQVTCQTDINTTGGFGACVWDAIPYFHGALTPDYFNTCASGSETGVPLNAFGTQNARTGNGYAGLFSGKSTNYIEEGIYQDITGLISGRVYLFEMYASLAESSTRASSIGFQIRGAGSATIFQYYHPHVITNKSGWTKISTCYTANGTESSIWISSNNVNYQQVPVATVSPGPGTYTFSNLSFPFAFYYIDDVTLKTLAVTGGSKSICGNNTNVGNAACVIAGASYQWAKVNGPGTVTFANANAANTNVSFSLPGTYQISLSATLNGCTDVETITITVLPIPNVTITPPLPSVCLGSSITLNASGANTYQWSNGATGSFNIVSPSNTTTYSVTGTSNGCSSTVSVTVNVNSLPVASIGSSANAICSGSPASVTLTASGGSIYSWNNSLGSGAVKSVSPINTTTYTVTVTSAAGCTATASRTVTVGTNPIAIITSDEIPGNCEHRLTVSDLSGGSGLSYLWSNSATSNQIIVKPNTQTTYAVTISNAAGCTATASGLWNRPVSCCTAANPALTFDGTISSTQLLTQASNILGASSVSGTTLMSGSNQIVINGTLSLNSNLTFLGCTEIRFGAYGRILTNGFNLESYTSTLKACSDYMWRGIEINNASAQVTLREFFGGKTLVYDAEFGILNASGGRIQTFNTEFINNYRGIVVRNVMPSLFDVYNTGFYTSGNLKTILNPNINNPIPIMNAGIEITDVFNAPTNPITVGKVFATRTNFNYFGFGNDNSLGAGIIIKNASARVVNSDFRISYTYGSGYTGVGCGIHAQRTSGTCALEVGDNTEPGSNIFSTGNNGVVQAFPMNVSIRRNTFQRITTGFFVSAFNTNSQIYFNNNTANSPGLTQWGVNIGSSNESYIEVNDNNLSFSSGSNAQISNPIGISISNSTSTSSTFRILIVNNMLRQVVKGIYTNNTDLPLVWGNGINIHARNYAFSNMGWAGVESISDKGINISQNYIDVEPTPASNLPTYVADNNVLSKSIGVKITAARTTPANINCDSILNMHWALAATGTSIKVNYQNNALMMSNGVRVGLALYNNPAFIGDQGTTNYTHNNKWYGSVNAGNNNFHLGYFGTPNSSAMSNQLFYFKNGYALNPTSGSIRNQFMSPANTTLGYNFVSSSNSILSCQPFTQTRSGKMSEEDLRFLQWMETFVSDTLATDSLNPYFSLWREEQIMLGLEENPWLRDESAILYDYYQNAGMESFIALHRLQKQADAVADSATAYQLLDENESVTPATRHEQNIQKLNALKLRHALELFTGNIDAIRPNPTDSAELRTLAAECYVTGGPSIFASRAYWNAVYQTIDNSFQDYCFETTGYYKTDSTKNVIAIPELFKVYPSLLQRGDAVSILSSEAGNIRLMDISGKVLGYYQFEKGTNQIQLIELAQSQLLLYDVITNSGKKYNGKIFVK